jgi:hypothetical protein
MKIAKPKKDPTKEIRIKTDLPFEELMKKALLIFNV